MTKSSRRHCLLYHRDKEGKKSADLYSRLYQYFITNCKLYSGNLQFVLHERYQPGFERKTSKNAAPLMNVFVSHTSEAAQIFQGASQTPAARQEEEEDVI